MTRACPVCLSSERTKVFSTTYKIPDLWTLPDKIIWFACDECGMIYGDGYFEQADFDIYYRKHYGYGVNSPANVKRLKNDARLFLGFSKQSVILDFGGAGDDGRSLLTDELKSHGFDNAVSIGAGDRIPAGCDAIYASHVLEHIYNLPETMLLLVSALKDNGLFIVDVPDSTGLLLDWGMPMIDYNTKHLNHFTLRTLLELFSRFGFEPVKVKPYDLSGGACYQVHFIRLNVGSASREHVRRNIAERIKKLQQIQEPVNVWGLGDVTWHILSQIDLDVLDYIDNDPAYRGETYDGKPVQERPTNDAPIVILAQGQRQRLIENIRKICSNSIIEI